MMIGWLLQESYSIGEKRDELAHFKGSILPAFFERKGYHTSVCGGRVVRCGISTRTKSDQGQNRTWGGHLGRGRFTPESGHKRASLGMSAFVHKRTSIIFQSAVTCRVKRGPRVPVVPENFIRAGWRDKRESAHYPSR